jgi:hypothetical protein
MFAGYRGDAGLRERGKGRQFFNRTSLTMSAPSNTF